MNEIDYDALSNIIAGVLTLVILAFALALLEETKNNKK